MALLEVRGLQKAFTTPDRRRELVVDVPEFTLDEGEQVGLRGGSGTGKTTFLHLVAGITEADAGSVRIDGRDMVELSESARDRLRATAIGYVFQTFNLLQGFSALENVLLGMSFGPGADRSRAAALLERVGLGGRMDHRPRALSVGEQQRVALARAVANRPRLILADEPTGNLDPVRAATALELLCEVAREAGAALLLVSHDPAVLARLGRVDDFERLNRAFVKERVDA